MICREIHIFRPVLEPFSVVPGIVVVIVLMRLFYILAVSFFPLVSILKRLSPVVVIVLNIRFSRPHISSMSIITMSISVSSALCIGVNANSGSKYKRHYTNQQSFHDLSV